MLNKDVHTKWKLASRGTWEKVSLDPCHALGTKNVLLESLYLLLFVVINAIKNLINFFFTHYILQSKALNRERVSNRAQVCSWVLCLGALARVRRSYLGTALLPRMLSPGSFPALLDSWILFRWGLCIFGLEKVSATASLALWLGAIWTRTPSTNTAATENLVYFSYLRRQ